MIKNRKYFDSLDLGSLRDEVFSYSGDRQNCEAYKDALVVFANRFPDTAFPVEELLEVVGKPNVIESCEQFEIWQFHWIGKFGSGTYHSCTPFVVKDGIAVRLASWEETTFGR